MDSSSVSRDRLLSANLSQLEVYLKRSGWQPKNADDLTLLVSPKGKTVRLPTGLPEQSYLSALLGLLEAVLDEEGRDDPSEFLDQIGTDEDIVYMELELPNLRPGVISLSDGATYIEQIRNFYAHAAATELEFRKSRNRLSTQSKAFVDSVLVGSSHKGSFALALHFPVDLGTFEPLGRRVWHRVMRGLDRLNVSSHGRSSEQLLELGDAGWNAEMCEIVSDLMSDTKAVEFGATVFSNKTVLDSLPEVPHRVRLDTLGLADVLSTAAATLRGLKASQTIEVSGPIYLLRNMEAIGEGDEHECRIKWTKEDGTETKVRVLLGGSDYDAALQAHKEGKKLRAYGVLHQKGTRWEMALPDHVDVIESPPESVASSD